MIESRVRQGGSMIGIAGGRMMRQGGSMIGERDVGKAYL